MKDTPSLGSLTFVTGPLAGKTYQITKPVITLGRDPSNDVAIPDPTVSRQHAQIALTGDAWVIRKVSAQNTLTLNKREIQQSPLLDHDTVGLGPGTTFLFESVAQPSAANVTEGAQNAAISLPSPGWGEPNVARVANSVPHVQPVKQMPPAQPAQPVQEAQPVQNIQTPPPPQAALVLPGSISSAASSPNDGTVASMPPAPVAAAAANVPPVVQTPPPVPGRNREATQRALEPFPNMNAGLTSQVPSTPAGPPSIEVSTNTDHVKTVFTLDPNKQVFDIGRAPDNAVVINRPTVSSYHAQIVREGNQLFLIHPNPKRSHTLNGLLYQGEAIGGDQQFRHALTRGDVFRISDENGTFVTLTYNDGSGQLQHALPEIRPIPLGARLITLGRADDNTVVLDHPQVSAYHARLEQVRGNTYRIIDNNSTNHVYVNGKRVTQPRSLIPGDEIRIGPFRLSFTGTQLTQHDESSSIRIDAVNLKKTVQKNKILINDISIVVPPRKFVALVGGSGAGKSTLMDALNGLRPAQNGKVFYNGQDYYHHLAAFSTQLGYVPQEDIIHRDLSVERALYYAAKLRLPQDLTGKQIKERINDVLEDVEMKHRRKTLISQLSGGQRKRVSIALELLANPSVFFLDEPTSGLDPGLDRKMMLLLRKLADKGHTIVLVTHATNNINACDYICFLCQGGRLAYFGPPNEAKTYFGKTDFAEIYSALEPTDENPNIPAEAEAKFRQSPDYQRYVVEQVQQGPAGKFNPLAETSAITLPKRGNPWKQFFLLSMRYIELLLNDRVNLAILVLQAPIIALVLYAMTSSGTFNATSIVGCLQQNGTRVKIVSCQNIVDMLNGPAGIGIRAANGNKTNDQLLDQDIAPGSGGDAQKILFIMAFAAVMFGCINGAREIVKEAAIYRRERTVNLGIMPYIFSKFVVLGLLSLLQAYVLVFMVNLAAPFAAPGNGLHGIIFDNIFLEIYISMALTALAGLMTGLLISAIVPNNDRAMSLVPLPLIPQVIFAGVIFNLDTSGLQVPGGFFAARWAMAALGSSVGLHNNKVLTDNFSYIGKLFPTAISNPNNLDPTTHLLFCWGMLVLMIIVQGVLIAWFLKRKDVRR